MTLEDLRNQAGDTTGFGEEPLPAPPPPPRRETGGRFLGMTPSQRFIIALILLVITCLLSTFCLLVTGKVVLPVSF
jgi:hypothetical protein